MIEEGIIVNNKKGDKAKKEYPEVGYNDRISICRECPIYMHEIGVCNPNKWLDPETMKSFDSERRGSYKGCGCRIESKAKKPSSHCNAGLW